MTIVVVVVLVRQALPLFEPKRGFEALVAAAQRLQHRRVEGRLSGGFPYKPMERAGSFLVEDGSFGADVAVRSVRAQPDSTDRTTAQHEIGVAHLLLREREEAVRSLEESLRAETGRRDLLEAVNRSEKPELLNDLAVAYLERGPMRDDPRDNLAAIECIERAWRLRKSAYIAWNRALALERAGFRERGQTAWNEYLELEPGSEWSAEAAEHIRSLSAGHAAFHPRDEFLTAIREAARRQDMKRLRSLAAEDPEHFRIIGEEVLLPEAARLLPIRGDVWNAMRQVASVLTERGELLLGDSLDALERADASSLAIAAEALVAFKRGRELRKPNEYKDAFALLSEAAEGLTKARIPLAVRAEIFRATIRMYDGHARGAVVLIDKTLAATPHIDRWPLTEAQLHWVRGLALHNDGDPGGALRAYENANRAITKTTESGSRAGVEQVYSDALRDVGDGREAWRHLLAAAAALDLSTPYGRKLNVLNGVVQQSAREGYRSLPTLIHADVLRLARSSGDDLFLCSTLLVGAQLAMENADFSNGEALLREAEAIWTTLGDSAMIRRVRADIETTRYRLMVAQGDEPQVDALTRSLSLVASIDNHTRIAELHLLRAKAFLQRADRDRAREDLRTGLGELESQREKLLDDEKRTQAAVAVDLFDQWITLEMDAGNDEAAFDVAERARARLLLERTGGPTLRQAFRWSEIRRRLPENVVLVAYSVLRDRLIVWRGTSDRLTSMSTAIERGTLRAKLERFKLFVAGETQSDTRSADDLYAFLCRDALAGTGARHVIFVPDSEMFDVSFAALRDAASGQYVLEQHIFAIQPSATLAVLAGERENGRADRGLLVVGVSNTPGLPVLPAVRREAQSIAARLPNATLLMDEQVTIDSFEHFAATSSVIHFAGHATSNPIRPERSALILGSGAAGSVLTAAQISAMHLDGVELVVLAACETGEGTSTSEAPMTLATAFMAAGASTVIASSMDTDDAASGRLFDAFYARYREGESIVDSLRAAQLALLRNPKYAEPRYWAPFTVISSVDHFDRRR